MVKFTKNYNGLDSVESMAARCACMMGPCSCGCATPHGESATAEEISYHADCFHNMQTQQF